MICLCLNRMEKTVSATSHCSHRLQVRTENTGPKSPKDYAPTNAYANAWIRKEGLYKIKGQECPQLHWLTFLKIHRLSYVLYPFIILWQVTFIAVLWCMWTPGYEIHMSGPHVCKWFLIRKSQENHINIRFLILLLSLSLVYMIQVHSRLLVYSSDICKLVAFSPFQYSAHAILLYQVVFCKYKMHIAYSHIYIPTCLSCSHISYYPWSVSGYYFMCSVCL